MEKKTGIILKVSNLKTQKPETDKNYEHEIRRE